MPTLNRWQTFELTEEIDGLDGEIKLCITCEDGKLDLNQWYDFNKKKFIGGEGTHRGKFNMKHAHSFDGKKIFKAVFAALKKCREQKTYSNNLKSF